MSQRTIRKARREDVGTILEFMHATAAEQNVADSVRATESDLLNTLDFADSDENQLKARTPAHGKVFLAVGTEDKITGMAIYFFTYVAWKAKPGVCLEDLYVCLEARREGFARLLLQAIAKEAELAGCERMEWMCFKDNSRALNFYKSLGAKEMDTIDWLRLDHEGLVKLANEEGIGTENQS